MKDKEKIAEVARWGRQRTIPEWIDKAHRESVGGLNSVALAMNWEVLEMRSSLRTLIPFVAVSLGSILATGIFTVSTGTILPDLVRVPLASGTTTTAILAVFILRGAMKSPEEIWASKQPDSVVRFYDDLEALKFFLTEPARAEILSLGGFVSSLGSRTAVTERAERRLIEIASEEDIAEYGKIYHVVKRFCQLKSPDHYRSKAGVV